MNVIEVNKISKKYIISHKADTRSLYNTLGEFIGNKIKNLIPSRKHRLKLNDIQKKEEFWALRDVSFNVSQGDKIGIIGRNGAGKSTLLKILSRITDPSEGNVKIKGRVASLLEVGTGFHQDLTGRENIFLNGAILGMKKEEIKRKFDEIVAFSEIEKFLDTPVKRYSSGMYVRLAFSVAAHLEPEILLVDEVLAVGDAEFQKKCLGKMGEVTKEGRTILFVSHNILAIKSLCNLCIFLEKGRIMNFGATENITDQYLTRSIENRNSKQVIEIEKNDFTIHSIEAVTDGIEGNFDIDKELVIKVKVSSKINFKLININLFFETNDNIVIFATCSPAEPFVKGNYTYECIIPPRTLNDNIYYVNVMVVENSTTGLILERQVLILHGNEHKREGAWMGKFPGLIRPQDYKWNKLADNG